MPNNTDSYGREANNDSLTMRAHAAMISAQLPHLSPGDAHVLAQRQYTDGENVHQAMGGAAGSTRSAMDAAMRVGAVGPGGIDVRSYTGSIYNGTATPIPGYKAPETMDQAADRILRAQFGPPPNERGQVDIAGAMGTRSVPVPGGYSAPNARMSPAAAMAPTGSSVGASPDGVPDYGAPPTSVDGLLRDARAPIVSAMAGRALLAQERAEKIAATRGKAAQEDTNKAALFRALQPVTALPSADLVSAAFNSGTAFPKIDSREPTFAEAMRGYLGAGGAPNAAAESAMKPLGAAPATIDFKVDPVTGARFAVGSKGNFAASGTQPGMPGRAPAKGAQKASGVEKIELGGQQYLYHHETKRYFSPDGQEAFVKGPAPKAPDPLLKTEDPELYQAQRDAYLEHFKARGATPPPEPVPAPGAKPAAAAAGGASAKAAAPEYKTPDDVRSAYQSGALKREEAAKILREKFAHK